MIPYGKPTKPKPSDKDLDEEPERRFKCKLSLKVSNEENECFGEWYCSKHEDVECKGLKKDREACPHWNGGNQND